MTGNVREGTLGVAELAEGHVLGLITCEGGGDVVGVVTPVVRGGAQVLHGDQVVEFSVLLEVHERVTACGCVSAGVHCGVRFCVRGRCAYTPHTGLSQRAHDLPRAECAQGWRSGRWRTNLSRLAHTIMCSHSCDTVLVRALRVCVALEWLRVVVCLLVSTVVSVFV